MTYNGHVENGIIVLDEPASLPDGVRVVVEVTGQRTSPTESLPKSRYDRYRSLIGVLDAMPENWATGHDAYLREQHGS